MKLDLFQEVLTKHLGARKDGSALKLPADGDVSLVVSLGGDALTVQRITRVEVLEGSVLVLETHKGEKVVVAVEDVRALKSEKSDTARRERGAGFGP